jgi:hypothetical protein
MKILMLLCFLIALMACSSLVPANVPPQLAATAGVSILITDEIVDAGWFTVNYPDGWRIVKLSTTEMPIYLVFAAPDVESQSLSNRGMIIDISETVIGRVDVTADASVYERFDTVSQGERSVYLRGQAPIEKREAFDAIFQQVMESIQFR